MLICLKILRLLYQSVQTWCNVICRLIICNLRNLLIKPNLFFFLLLHPYCILCLALHKGSNVSADSKSDEFWRIHALSTPNTHHQSAALASGQYSLDQNVNKSPSHLREKHKIEREEDIEGWMDNMDMAQDRDKKRDGDST